MDSIKTWLIEVGIKKMGPSMVRAAVGAITGLILAHSGALAKYGVTYDSVTDSIIISLKTMKDWLVVGGGLGVITGFVMGGQHHVMAAVTGAPQSGDLRQGPEAAVPGGNRAGDPPAGGQA